MKPTSGRTVELRAQLTRWVLWLLSACQPEDAVLVLKEALASYRTFDEICAEAEAKAIETKEAVRLKLEVTPDDGNFG